MTDEQPERTAEQQDSTSEARVLEKLQAENESLKSRLEEAAVSARQREDLDHRLAEAESQNQQLRRRLAGAAVREEVARAAQQVGIPPEAGLMHEHKFECEIDEQGCPRVTPDPVEFFQGQLRRNPSLRSAADRYDKGRQASAIANGAIGIDQADPAELMAALDRNVAKKTRFIARHGVQAYLELCDRARRKTQSR